MPVSRLAYFLPWRWRLYFSSKRRLTSNGLHGIISQKISTAVRISNPAFVINELLYWYRWHEYILISNSVTKRQMIQTIGKISGIAYNSTWHLCKGTDMGLRIGFQNVNEVQGFPKSYCYSRSGCLTHSLMELSPSWEATNCAATRELPSILYVLVVYHFKL
jgi:hypothetical protein